MVGEAGDGREPIRLALTLQPGVAVLDIGTPLLNGIEAATVDTHRAHSLQKLDLHNTAGLVLYAVRHGVIS